MSPASPADGDKDDFTLSITADGQPLDNTLRVLRVDVWSAIDAVAKASVVLMADAPSGEPFSVKTLPLERGETIEIQAGYSGRPDVIFSGTVVSHRVNLAVEASAIIVNAEGAGIPVVEPDARDPVLTLEHGVSIISFKAETIPGKSRVPELRGEVSFPGSALPQPGSIIELAGVGGIFDGDMFVSAVHHDITEGRWTTHVRFRERPDPLKPPPVSSPADDRAIPTRLDGTDRAIVIRTAGGLTISLNDTTGQIHIADAKQSSIVLGTGGVRIDSASNVEITAAGQIELKAGAGLKLVSSGVTTVQGSLVKIN